MGIKLKASPYAHLAKVYGTGSDQVAKTTPHLSCKINGIQ
jgi:hypothetical protein